ncbi:MAG: ATP-binding protein [Verrucomicrobiaceae bacterium]|nr:ATP-binding protein [Verrucomicrobiaceae bacterium]
MATLTAAKANLQRLALVRLVVVIAELIALIYAIGWLHADLHAPLLFGIAGVILFAALLTFWRLTRPWPVTDVEFFAQLLLDVGSLSVMLYASGGATNPFVSYYLVPLSIAAAVLPWIYTASLALICVGLYSSLLFFYVPLPLFSPALGEHQHHADSALNPHIFGMWCNFALSAALITYVVVRMANTLREQQRELNLRREQALHNEQLLAVATLAAGTAHELGTPLGTMMVLLDDMQSTDAELNGDIAMLKQQVHSCRSTLKKLVSTAETHQQQQFAVQPADIFMRELVQRWYVVRPAANCELQCSAGDAPALRVDETLRQAIINLLDNGADADSGTLQLTLSWDQKFVALRVRDHGAGIGFEIADQLGKPFVTSKGKGLGLGLFLSHATIERCGGDIRLFNHPDGGTEAVLRLPVAPDLENSDE